MSYFSYDLLRSYYMADPTGFKDTLSGTSYTSQVYQELVSQTVDSVNKKFNSTSSTVVRLDLNGNIIFSNSSGIFGYTKDDIKKFPGSVRLSTQNEIFLADAVGKKGVIIEVSTTSASGAIQSTFVSPSGPIDQDEIDFNQAAFGNIDITLNFSKTRWEYKSSRYVTGFYLDTEVKKQISIQDGVINEPYPIIRYGQEIEWVNNSSKPISIYSGVTTVGAFDSNPDLSLYGQEFKSGVLQPGETYSYKFITKGRYGWFVYPEILTGVINVSENRINAGDKFLITENDGLSTPFTSRVIKVDTWGNVLFDFGSAYLIKPRKSSPLLNGNIMIST